MTTPASPDAAPLAKPSSQPDADATPQSDEQQPEPDTNAAEYADAADDAADGDEHGEDDDRGKASRQAARYCVQFREARDRNVELAAALGLQQQALVDILVKSAGLDPAAFSKLMESNGAELDSFIGDDGQLDPQRVAKAIGETACNYGLRPNVRPKPVRGQGHAGSGGSGKGWSDLLGDAAGRGRR